MANVNYTENLRTKLDTCQRRIQGHINEPSSNIDRFLRLLKRETELQNELFSSQRNKSRSSGQRRR